MKPSTIMGEIGGGVADSRSPGMNATAGVAEGWEAVVRQLVSTLRFGVVQITIHESHVVQVERTEKVRFAQPASPKPDR
jgi:hypothetical protein